MLQEPQLSAYDLQFRVLGFHVRVTWGFWVMAAVLGWNTADAFDTIYGELSPGAAPLLVVYAVAIFLSILIHELGHCFLFRRFGTESRIVLYHFGGLAIPGAFTDWNAARRRRISSPQQLIAISAAGPALQIIAGCLLLAVAISTGTYSNVLGWIDGFVDLPIDSLKPSDSPILQLFLDSFIYISTFWAVLNLLPIMPLDGGQIMRELFRLFRVQQPLRNAAIVSMVTAATVGVWMFQIGNQGFGLMCLAFVASNFQLYQQSRFTEL